MLEESLQWLERHTVDRRYVPVSELNRAPDCGATASWMPTLLQVGEHTMAKNFAEYLMAMQRPDGSFASAHAADNRVFAAGQIIRGWAAVAASRPEVREPMRRACEWIVSVSDPVTGKFTVPTPDTPRSPGKRDGVHEAIHLYVVQPMRDAAAILDAPHFREAADRALNAYISTLDVSHFDRLNALAHDYGFIQEALLETGNRDLAIAGMNSVSNYQRREGWIPAYYDVSWVSTPGLAQLAKVWLMLGDNLRAQAALGCLRHLQNYSGGFYGSYGPSAAYFPAVEVSSAPKFAIDAEILELKGRGLTSKHSFIRTLDIGHGQAMTAPPRSAKQALSPAAYPVKVSIVLPTYNHAKYLPEALQSIFGQTFIDYELIIVDDGSTDATAEMLCGIKHPKLRVITQDNQGVAAALNTGFAQARGEYWTWTSADNVVGPAWLEELVKALDESPAEIGFALSSHALMNEIGEIKTIDDFQCFETDDLLLRCGYASFLYRSQVAREAGIYDSAMKPAEDLDMWLRMSVLTRAVHVESVLYYYRVHGDSMTSKFPEAIVRATIRVNEKFVESSGGTLDVDRIFCGIARSADPAVARWQAQVWFAARLAQSPFWPVGPVVDLYISALLARYDQSIVGNIVLITARQEEWAAAASVIASCMQAHSSPFLSDLAAIVARQDKEALIKIPLMTIPDSALSFDMMRQFSRSELSKNVTENIDYSKIYDEMYKNSIVYSDAMDDSSGRGIKDPFIFPIVKSFAPANLVDLGCGQGYYLRRFREDLNIDAFGVEVSAVCCKKYLKELPHVNIDLQQYLEAQPKHDFIFCTDVLEHISRQEVKEILGLASNVAPVALFGLANHSDVQLGVELHVIRENQTWWENLLAKYYANTKVVANLYGGRFFFILCVQNDPAHIGIFDLFARVS